MSVRLQVLFDEAELDDIRAAAAEQGVTVSEWVRQAARHARRDRAEGDRGRKLEAIRAAARHAFPSGDVERMLEEIERGYLGRRAGS